MSLESSASPARRSRLPWILLAVVVAVIAGVTLYRQFQARGEAAKPASSMATDASGEQQARRLSPAEVRALAARSVGQGAPETAADMAQMMEKRKRVAAATQERIQARNAQMASRFAAEKPDPAWASAHERDLASLQDSGPMRDAGAKAEDFKAECRSSLCRIQADFPNQSMASDWLQLYMSGVGDRLPVATAHQVVNPDGSVRIEIYGNGRGK